MPKKKKELTLDPALVDEFVIRHLNLEREATIARQDMSDLQLEFVDKGLHVKAVKAVIRAEKALKRAGAPEDELDQLAIRIKAQLDVND